MAKHHPNTIIAHILPFIGMGIFLVLFVIALIFLSYIFLIGSLIGLVLFAIAYIKSRFFSRQNQAVARHPRAHKSQVYNNDEFK